MSNTRWTDAMIKASSAANPAQETDQDTAQEVIKAYAAALMGSQRNRAFDSALRAYRTRHPGVSEPVARRRVARVLCFAGTKSLV